MMIFNHCQYLLILRKTLLIDLLTGLSHSINLKKNSYDSFPVIVDQLTKIVNYQLVNPTRDITVHAKVIINIVIPYYGLLDLIFTNKDSISIS